MASPTGYLLDTNILVYLIRGKAVGQAIDANYGLSTGGLIRSMVSVVTVGEVYSLVRKWGWGQKKIDELQRMLGQLAWININHPDILATYAELDDHSNKVGKSMGKNDVWIAATAKVAGIELLTTDSDFDHLHPVHLKRIKIDANTGNPIP